MEQIKTVLLVPLLFTTYFAGPATYVICVVDTWQSGASVFVKFLVSFTLDAIMAALWPITWAIWIVIELAGGDSPISNVLGF